MGDSVNTGVGGATDEVERWSDGELEKGASRAVGIGIGIGIAVAIAFAHHGRRPAGTAGSRALEAAVPAARESEQ